MDEARAIGEEYKKSVVTAFSGLYDEKRKVRYTASADVQMFSGDETNAHDYNVVLRDAKIPPGKAFVSGINFGVNTQENTVGSVAATIDPATGTVKPRNPQIVALTILHEAGHTGNVGHPFETTNTAEDVDLTRKTINLNGKEVDTYVLSPGADRKKVLSNVMIYTVTSFEGQKVNDLNGGDPTKLNKFSPDQANILLQQILKDPNGKSASTPSAVQSSSNGNR